MKYFFLLVIVCFSQAARSQEVRELATKPDAIIDLSISSNLDSLKAQWKIKPAWISDKVFNAPGPSLKDPMALYPTGKPTKTHYIIPQAYSAEYNDTEWMTLPANDLNKRSGEGLLSFVWYRINVTLPSAAGHTSIKDSKIFFEIVADDYSEIWINGKQQKLLGQSGNGLISGWNSRNRVLLTDHAIPGEQFQIAILVTNGPIGNLPENYVWIRNASLDIYSNSQQTLPVAAGKIISIEPELNNIINTDAIVEKVADGFSFTEGPVWHPEGYLLFSDPNDNVIYRYDPDTRNIHIYLTKSGYSGLDIGRYHQPGSNGLALDTEGRLVFCQHGNRCIVRMEAKGPVTVLSDHYEGHRLNSPNDLVLKSDGSVYFTDPPYGLPMNYTDPSKELKEQGVYRIKDGKTQLLTNQLGGPNGIAFSPDEKYLYVTNWDIRDIHHTKTLWRFDVDVDGRISNGVIFFNFNFTDDDEALDGIKVDAAGNLYVSAPGGVSIIRSDGKYLGKIICDERPANMAWGDADGKTLYMTAHTGLYKIKTKIGKVRQVHSDNNP